MLPPPPAAVRRTTAAGLARGLERDAFGRDLAPPPVGSQETPPEERESTPRKEAATESIGRRAGALSDELDFPEFVASLVHGTFDAIVDSSIRQMESFADLVAAVAKPIEEFTQDNVSINQARDWLVEQFPKDLILVRSDEGSRVAPRPHPGEDGGEPRAPEWLTDFGLGGQDLSAELVEEELVPRARERVAQQRLQTLSTMVLLGMNRVVVRDGTIGARLRFRAAAADHTKLDYAVSDDHGEEAPAAEWGWRGSRSYSAPRTKVSTVGVNVQSDSELKAELFGEVKINFASETVPLDRFVDDARRNTLERHARPARRVDAPRPAPAAETTQSAPAVPTGTAGSSTPTAGTPAPGAAGGAR